MDPLLQSLQSRILPEDIALFSDGSIKALSVNEVLAITHAIDHQLSMMKRGVMGTDIVGFVAHLLSTGHLDPTTFPRSPTALELQLCRKLARIEDSDIVTQLQILRMLDAFRTLVVLFQRNLMGVIGEELARGGRGGGFANSNKHGAMGISNTSPMKSSKNNKNSSGGGGDGGALAEDVAARIDLTSDVCASAAALTDDTLFASAYGGMIPTYVLYQLAERYGLDARSCFHPYSAVSLLPTTDDAVIALRDLKAKEEEQRQRLAAGNNKSASVNQQASQRSDDDESTVEFLNTSAGGTTATAAAAVSAAAATAEQNRRKASNAVQKNIVVPVEFISPVVLTDTFTPLDKKLLRVFTDTFGAFDPNDPHNQFGLSSDLVDGHYLLILPVQKFAQVLRISLVRASKVIQNALEGVVGLGRGGGNNNGGSGGLSVGSASTRRKSLRHPTTENLSTAGGDEMEDLFGVWGADSIDGGGGGSVGLRSLSPMPGQMGKKMSFISEAVTSTRTPPPPALNPNNSSNLATSQRGDGVPYGAAEALPSPFHVVLLRGYLRFPEFELVIRYLNQDSSGAADPAKSRKEAQQVLVDELVARNSNAQLSSAKGSSSLATAASPQQTELARQLSAAARRQRGVFAPSGQDEQMLIDAQASFIEKALFNLDGSLRLTLNTNNSNNNATLAKRSGRSLRGTDITSPNNEVDAADRKFPTMTANNGQDPSGGAAVVSPTVGGNSGVGGGSEIGMQQLGGGDRRQSTFTRSKKGSHHEHSHQHSPSSPTASTTGGGGAPLHGWAIHDHPAERLAVKPMNGKDVNRLRKSFVSSPGRTTHSYTTNTEATISAVLNNAATDSSRGNGLAQNTTGGSSNAGSSNNNNGGVGGPSSQANNNNAVGGGSGASVLQRRVVSPRQRQLMEVLNLEKMAEVMDRIPEDPLGLFTNSLLGGGANGGVAVSSGQPGVSNTGAGQVGQTLLSPHSGGAGGVPASHLSIAALLQHTDSSVNGAYFGGGGGTGSMNTQQTGGAIFAMELDPSGGSSKRSGGIRSTTKAGGAAAARNHQQQQQEGGLLLSPTLLGASRHQRLLSSSGNEDELSVSQNLYDVTVCAPEAAVPLNAGGGDSAAGGGAAAAFDLNGNTASNAGAGGSSRSHHRTVPLRSNGIHAQGWRSVHYIPKLQNDSISDYCDSVKRSGGGFGERGRLLPSSDMQAAGSGSDAEEHHDGGEPVVKAKRKRHHRKAHHSNPTVPIDEHLNELLSEAAPKPTKERRIARPKNDPSSEQQPQGELQHFEEKEEQRQKHQPHHRDRTNIAEASAPRRLPPAPASPRLAKDPDLAESAPHRVPVPPAPRRPAGHQPQQPATARRPNESSSLAASTAKSHNTTSSSKSARQPTASTQSVPPPPRGFMAVMDNSRQPHGGTMLSFIPPALAMDVVRSIDLRSTFPNSPGGGGQRQSVRGSLLEPLGQGARGTQVPLQEARDPLHEAAMARSREQMGKLRFTS
ncbi:Hypothetical protein, putative [Bodo saltans]|uniref:Uncharacterized protein n=1 Tax=Bodo saltans TaxID=75058 RepID=A0A0S4JH65_BODSA|nr:Hypothetical protein, putative [Bodo saltans]|eukprot:CUG90863.1 Hypothetical protein, putative [Bodo saltans]